MELLEKLLTQFPQLLTLLSALGTLAVLGTIYVKMTPDPTDDSKLAAIEAHPVYGYILRALRGFSLVKPKVE